MATTEERRRAAGKNLASMLERRALARLGLAERAVVRNAIKREITVGDLTLVPGKGWVVWKGAHVYLSSSLYAIVEAMASRPDWVFSRDKLQDVVGNDEMFDRSIDSAIKRIRRQFERVDQSFDRIQTLYGLGYKWRSESGRLVRQREKRLTV